MIDRIEADTLLKPFDGAPAGESVREGGASSDLYLRIKDERAAARIAEREASNAESDSDPLRAGLIHWASLAEGAVTLLTDHTKDLEVAAWLTEALLRTGGIAGLGDGFLLLDGLITAFWDEGLWPIADEDGDETRLGALFGIFGRGGTGTLLQPLKLVPLSDRGSDAVTLWSAEVAFAPQAPRNSDEDVQAVADKRRSDMLDAVTNGIARSSRPFLIALRHDLDRAATALEQLMQTVDRVSTVGRFGSQIGEPLAAAIKLLDDNAGNVFATAAPEMVAVPLVLDDPTPGAAGPRAAAAPMSRDGALNQILALADHFERSEPQSPIGLSLREVVRRARMPLADLLSELLPDPEMRTLFLQRAGIRSASSDVEFLE